MTHVFIVNENTFNYHLQYMFAGTGYSQFEPQLKSTDTEPYLKETTLTGMIADISKVRKGDYVLFYVTGCKKLFGIFKVSSRPFFNSLTNDYLGVALGKYLPFRIRIEPHIVFAKGVSEQKALDDISSVQHPYEMCWSLIYRKLAGMRGCSFVTDAELKKLLKLLRTENDNVALTGMQFYYDSRDKTIKTSANNAVFDKKSMVVPLSIDTRLFNIKKSFEGHLQAYIMQHFDENFLYSLLFPIGTVKFWIGNEVICSVGEKRIDILIIAETKNEVVIRIIELKDETPKDSVINEQIPWYIQWVDQYIAPTYISTSKSIKIIPTIIALPYARKCPNQTKFEAALKHFNKTKVKPLSYSTVEPIERIIFSRRNNAIEFFKI